MPIKGIAKNKYESVRISPEAKEKLRQLGKGNGITMVTGLDRLLQIEAKTSKAITDIVRNTIPTKPTKPPSAIIDASILYSFKQLGKKTLTRKDIKEAVITMMQESKYPTTWARVNPSWWENYRRNKSKFELDFDNRLRRLVKDKLISNEPMSGEYSHNLTTKHWDYVQRLATGFYPQIVIDKIVSITL